MTGNVRAAMSQQSSPSAPREDHPKGDPWHAVGYIVSGVGLYGFLGWLADQWLGTRFLVAVGILVGAGLGLYLTFARFNRPSGNGDQAAEYDEKNDEKN